MIELDGSYGEGGGAIVRNALIFSSLFLKSFIINNIRRGRSTPGLKNQHLFAIDTLKNLTKAKVIGNIFASERLEFKPKEKNKFNININLRTAGSITLYLQAVLPYFLFKDKKTHNQEYKIIIEGGTDVKWSPTVDYMKNCLFYYYKDIAAIDLKIIRRGYFPKGGGKVELKLKPRYYLEEFLEDEESKDRVRERINCEKGSLKKIKIISTASSHLKKRRVAERQSDSAKQTISQIMARYYEKYKITHSNNISNSKYNINSKYNTGSKYNTNSKYNRGGNYNTNSNYNIGSKYNIKIEEEIVYSESLSPGSSITILAYFENKIFGYDNVGEIRKRAEEVGSECAEQLTKDLVNKINIDYHMQDQLLWLASLVKKTKMKPRKVSNHTKTNLYVIEKFLSGLKFHTNECVIEIE